MRNSVEVTPTILMSFQLDIMFHNAGQSQRANWEKIDIQVRDVCGIMQSLL